MDKAYNPDNIEQRWYEFWESSQAFTPSGDKSQAPFCIMIPPPNVTGSLHMGHAFQHTIMDALTRLSRMQGKNTLWQPGTDHAGIATQMVVERLLEAEGSSRKAIGREQFVDRVWQWKNESGNTITNQMRRLGDSPDWERERFTMDEDLSAAVTEVFVSLYEQDLIYRGKRLVNWDPKFHTAISDLEVENIEEQGSLWHFRYPLANGATTKDNKNYLVVATTRPETMLGDTAVAVHPDDERYSDLIGQYVLLPIVNRKIPIIADDYVDKEFGTGCVKITPAHDFNDYDVGKRHQLPLVNLFDQNAAILEAAEAFTYDGKTVADFDNTLPAQYRGLDRFDARKQIVKDFDDAGLLETIKDHTLQTPRGDRSGAVVEPYLTDQWYVRTGPLAEPAIDAVKNGDIRFVPENWSKTYFNWMNNIEDWCISRQLWWGHRIPAWYDDDGKAYVGRSEQEVREKYQLDAATPLHQDDDVLDTWFSSALWPFATLGWPNKQEDIDTYLPTNVLVTGFDIIFFWVARMIMMSLKFVGKVPFKEVYITGLIKDEHGNKMSKSKGNVLDPIDLIDGIDLEKLVEKRTRGLMQPKARQTIEKRTRKEFSEGIAAYGTDALRFTFCALASTSRDIKFDLARTEGYRNFCNKLWNASRYVLMNTENQDTGIGQQNMTLSLPDRWIQSRLVSATDQVLKSLADYRFDIAANAIYEFTKNEYCDWYLELSKPVLYGEASEEEKRGTRHTLVNVLETLLRLAHPIIPFITEEIWQRVAPLTGKQGKTIMLQAYPEANKALDLEASDDIEWLKTLIIAIRNLRGELGISPAKAINILLKNADSTDAERLDRNRPFIRSLAKLEQISILSPEDNIPPCATALAKHMEVLVPLAGLIDKDAELQRLNKELAKLEQDMARVNKKLGNEKFTANAPKAVIEKEQNKLAEFESAMDKLKEQKQKIEQL